MNKIFGGVIIIMLMNTCVYAADLPAEINYLTINSNRNDLQYVTDKGQIAYMDFEPDGIFDFDIQLLDEKLYYNNVQALAETYDDTYYNDFYYIDTSGDLYQYYIDGDFTKSEKVKGISNCVKVCCGKDFMLALLSDGTVWSWGDNSYGQLGNDSVESNNTPSKIEELDDIVDITAGTDYAYAVNSEGKLFVWGLYRMRGENINENERVIKNLPYECLKNVEDCIRVDTADENRTFVMTASGKVYVHPNCDGISYELKIGKCIDMSACPISSYVFSPIILTDDGNVWQWACSNGVADGQPDYEPSKTTYINNLVKVVAGGKNMYISSDGSAWSIKPDEHFYWNRGEAKCIISADSENKLSMQSVRFIKRSEAAETFIKLYEELSGENIMAEENVYNDVESVYQSSIDKCAISGIMNGTDKKIFSPNKVLRREQAAVILSRILDKTGKSKSLTEQKEKFTDDYLISDWAKDSVYKTASFFDTDGKQYNPKEYISSDELDKVISKVKSF